MWNVSSPSRGASERKGSNAPLSHSTQLPPFRHSARLPLTASCATSPRLYLDLDDNSNGYVTSEECGMFLSFVALDLDVSRRPATFYQYDLHANGQLTRMEFCLMCCDVLWHVPLPRLVEGMSNLKDVKRLEAQRCNTYWNAKAEAFDSVARITMPVLYCIALVLIFNSERWALGSNAASRPWCHSAHALY